MKRLVTLFMVSMLAFSFGTRVRADSAGDKLASQIEQRVQQALKALFMPKQLRSVTDFERLIVTGTWTELWPDGRGGQKTLAVKGRIWNAAIAATLAKHGAAHLPKRNEPYYLDDPIVLKTGQRLSADREAEIRLRPGVNTCMVRNEHIVDGHKGPVPAGVEARQRDRHRRRHLDHALLSRPGQRQRGGPLGKQRTTCPAATAPSC